MKTNFSNKQTVINWLDRNAKSGKTAALISPVKINELNDSQVNELIYGHYIYILGNSKNEANNALELLSQSGLILYVKTNAHNEIARLIDSIKIPYIMITNLDLEDTNKAASNIIMTWSSKKSLENLTLNLARYCKDLFVTKNYLSKRSENYSLLASTNEKWRKLWYAAITIRRRSRIYKCISKKNVYKRKA